jgi:hypothetical protein
MTPAENKAVVRRFLDEVIGAGNMSAAVEVCTADLVWHGAGVGELVGLEAFTHGVAPSSAPFRISLSPRRTCWPKGTKWCAATDGVAHTTGSSSASAQQTNR